MPVPPSQSQLREVLQTGVPHFDRSIEIIVAHRFEAIPTVVHHRTDEEYSDWIDAGHCLCTRATRLRHRHRHTLSLSTLLPSAFVEVPSEQRFEE